MGLGFLLGALPSVLGGLNAASARRRAEAAQQAALNEYQSSFDTQYNNLLTQGSRDLNRAAGVGGDAVASFGRGLGDRLASAGVYNSSATAGAIQNASASTQANLADLAQHNLDNASSVRAQGMGNLAQMKLGIAGGNVANARGDEAASRGGLVDYLGSLAQATTRAPAPMEVPGPMQGPPVSLAGPSVFNNEQTSLQNMGVNGLQLRLPGIMGQAGKSAGLADLMRLNPKRNPFGL